MQLHYYIPKGMYFRIFLQDAVELLQTYDNSELIILNHQSSSIYSIKLN